MTIASLFSPRRCRILALCVVSVALHYVIIDWVATRLGPQRSEVVATPAPIMAELHLSLPKPELALLPTAVVPPVPRKRPPVARAAPAPVRLPVVADSPLERVPALPAAVAPAALPEVPAPVVTAPEPAAPGPHYRVNLPPSAQFDFEVKRIDADGTAWSGVAAMKWQHDATQYTLSVEAGLNMLITRINLLVLSSEGYIDDSGINPVTATEKRKGRSLTATHFNHAAGRISFSASEQSLPLPEGAQDQATLPFQLAGIGRADANQLAANTEIVVGEATEANLFRFALVGEEEIETKMGRFMTWHLSRPPKAGTYSSRLDIWLAPSRDWYPVQIRNTEASGALTTQTISNITTGK